MDKDRVEGSAKEIKGKAKEVAGKVLGDAKLESEGKTDGAAGKIQTRCLVMLSWSPKARPTGQQERSRMLSAASKTRSRGSHRYGEVLVEVAGKVLGDAKLESEGKTDRAAGKIQTRCLVMLSWSPKARPTEQQERSRMLSAASKTRSRGSNRDRKSTR